MDTIESLTEFYGAVIYSDDEDESDATEVILDADTVDEHMEALLAKWGMNWYEIVRLGEKHTQARPQQAGTKRSRGDSVVAQKKVILERQ